MFRNRSFFLQNYLDVFNVKLFKKRFKRRETHFFVYITHNETVREGNHLLFRSIVEIIFQLGNTRGNITLECM